MSIESEILRIQRNVADTYSIVADRGGNVPNAPTSARLAEAVSSIPANVLTAGDGVTIENNKINVDIPTKTLTRSEYAALSQEEKEKDIVYAVLDEKEVDDRITMDDIEQAIQNAITDLDVYSTEETRIGTWIDGKPIYRKTFYVSSAPSSSTFNIASLSDYHADVLIRAWGSVKISDSSYYNLPSNGTTIDFRDGHFRVYSNASISGKPVYATYEYTKTTG